MGMIGRKWRGYWPMARWLWTCPTQERTMAKVQVAKALAQRISAYALSVKTVDAQVQAMVRTIRCPGGQWDIGVMLTTNDHIHKLNKGYRKKDKPTDILSFPFHKIRVPGRFPRVTSSDERYLGDIYISIPYVQSQCEVEDFTLEERMPVLLAHGICHLLGYDHERDEDFARMSKAEEYILDRYERYLPPGRLQQLRASQAKP